MVAQVYVKVMAYLVFLNDFYFKKIILKNLKDIEK